MTSVRVPANVDLEDKILYGLTARQVGLLAPVAAILLGGWHLLNGTVPVAVLLGGCAMVAAIAVTLVLGRRDGTSLDRLVWAAIRHPRTRLATGHVASGRSQYAGSSAVGTLTGPARTVTSGGLDLGSPGIAIGLDASGINFGLRSGPEQAMVVSGFARLLHSLTGPVHIIASTHPATMDNHVRHVRASAKRLGKGRLRNAARAYVDWLDDMSETTVLVRREFTIVTTASTATEAMRVASSVSDACAAFGVACRELSGEELAARIRSYVDPYTATPGCGGAS